MFICYRKSLSCTVANEKHGGVGFPLSLHVGCWIFDLLGICYLFLSYRRNIIGCLCCSHLALVHSHAMHYFFSCFMSDINQ